MLKMPKTNSTTLKPCSLCQSYYYFFSEEASICNTCRSLWEPVAKLPVEMQTALKPFMQYVLYELERLNNK